MDEEDSPTRSKSGMMRENEMRDTIDRMYGKYQGKRIGGQSARPTLVASSQTIGLKKELETSLPRLKGKGSEPRKKPDEPKVTHPT